MTKPASSIMKRPFGEVIPTGPGQIFNAACPQCRHGSVEVDRVGNTIYGECSRVACGWTGASPISELALSDPHPHI